MARMIPPYLANDYPYSGEAEVFYALKDDPVTRDWIVLHSLDLPQHIKQVSGEIDFVIVIPNRGIVVVEVKGHNKVERRDGEWCLGTQKETRGPFKQASSAMHSLRNKLNKLGINCERVPFVSMVIFPRCRFDVEPFEWEEWQVADYETGRGIGYARAIERCIEKFRLKLASKPHVGFHTESEEPHPKQVTALVHALRSNFECSLSAQARRNQMLKELEFFTGEQAKVLDDLSMNRRLLILGPAGTGKSFLAVEKVRRLLKENKRVLFLCFNRLLAQQLQTFFDSDQRLSIKTVHSYMQQLSHVPFQDSYEYWSHDLPESALCALLNGDSPQIAFDAIVIDEAQDFLLRSIIDVLDLSIKGGWRAGEWYVFGDPDFQKIYSSSDFDFIETLKNKYSPACYGLRINCRNTIKIGSFGASVAKMNPGYSEFRRKTDSTLPELRYYRDDFDQRILIDDLITRCKNDGFAESDIVVLSFRSAGRSTIASENTISKIRIRPFSNSSAPGVRYASVFEFKGLEAPVVIVTDIEELKSEQNRALAYVAFTRALDQLLILAEKSVEPALLHTLIGVN